MKHKMYLGDGVYVAFDEERGMIVLTTEDGYSTTNTIYMEAEVFATFIQWSKKISNIS